MALPACQATYPPDSSTVTQTVGVCRPSPRTGSKGIRHTEQEGCLLANGQHSTRAEFVAKLTGLYELTSDVYSKTGKLYTYIRTAISYIIMSQIVSVTRINLLPIQ